MNETIVLTAEQWAELKALAQDVNRAWNVKSDGRAIDEWTLEELDAALSAVTFNGVMLMRAIKDIEDENTRRERLGLAGVEL